MACRIKGNLRKKYENVLVSRERYKLKVLYGYAKTRGLLGKDVDDLFNKVGRTLFKEKEKGRTPEKGFNKVHRIDDGRRNSVFL